MTEIIGARPTLAPWISGHLPQNYDTYVEPYCHNMSVFLHEPRHGKVILNNTNDDIVVIYQVFLNETLMTRLHHMLAHTPYSRSEYSRIAAVRPLRDDYVTRAWRMIVLYNFSYAGRGIDAFRPSGSKGHLAWMEWLDWFKARLSSVELECRSPVQLIKSKDGPRTLFFIDLPGAEYRREREEFDATVPFLRRPMMVYYVGNGQYSEDMRIWRRVESKAHDVLLLSRNIEEIQLSLEVI